MAIRYALVITLVLLRFATTHILVFQHHRRIRRWYRAVKAKFGEERVLPDPIAEQRRGAGDGSVVQPLGVWDAEQFMALVSQGLTNEAQLNGGAWAVRALDAVSPEAVEALEALHVPGKQIVQALQNNGTF